MTATLAMLVAGLVPTTQPGFADTTRPITLAIPARCFFHRPALSGKSIDYQASSAILSIVLLGLTYIKRVVKLFQWSSGRAQRYLRVKPRNMFLTALGFTDTGVSLVHVRLCRYRITYIFLLVVYVMAKATHAVMESMLWEASVAL
jgi:hypothetical protein